MQKPTPPRKTTPTADYPASDSEQGDTVYAQGDSPITPELKQAIAEEVQQQISYENAASQKPSDSASLTGLPQVMQPGHLFVANEPIGVSTTDNQSCDLSAGDTLKLREVPPSDSAAANVADDEQPQGRLAGQHCGDRLAGAIAGDAERLPLQQLRNTQGTQGLPAAPKSAFAPRLRPVESLPPDSQDAKALINSAGQ